MKVLVAFGTLAGFVWTGALYESGHWIAATAVLCACGWIVTTQAPDTETDRKEANDVD